MIENSSVIFSYLKYSATLLFENSLDFNIALVPVPGVDRLSTNFYDWGNWLSGGFAFNTADNLWTSFKE